MLPFLVVHVRNSLSIQVMKHRCSFPGEVVKTLRNVYIPVVSAYTLWEHVFTAMLSVVEAVFRGGRSDGEIENKQSHQHSELATDSLRHASVPARHRKYFFNLYVAIMHTNRIKKTSVFHLWKGNGTELAAVRHICPLLYEALLLHLKINQ